MVVTPGYGGTDGHFFAAHDHFFELVDAFVDFKIELSVAVHHDVAAHLGMARRCGFDGVKSRGQLQFKAPSLSVTAL
jgi:hypothetical protein